eukprot:1161554-Pelagomonas_calceolata.AAC.6
MAASGPMRMEERMYAGKMVPELCQVGLARLRLRLRLRAGTTSGQGHPWEPQRETHKVEACD